MAEGIVNNLFGDFIEAKSAGSRPAEEISPYAIKVMREIGIDITNQKPKSVNEFKDEHFDLVITVCNKAKEECPYSPNAEKIIHKSFSDPEEAEENKLEAFKKVRNEIKEFIEKEILKYFNK